MPKSPHFELSRRERQIMDAVYRRGRATAVEVSAELPNAPGNSAVRAMLAILVRKGLLKIQKEGARFVYLPTRPRAAAGRSAIRRVVETFFGGSLEGAVAALLDDADSADLTPQEIARLKALIDKPTREDAKK
jgi:predicted transcriptional regulator